MKNLAEILQNYGLKYEVVDEDAGFDWESKLKMRLKNKSNYNRTMRVIFNEECNVTIENKQKFQEKFNLPEKYRNKENYFYDSIVVEVFSEKEKTFILLLDIRRSLKKELRKYVLENEEKYKNELKKFELVSLFKEVDPYQEVAKPLREEISEMMEDESLDDCFKTVFKELSDDVQKWIMEG